MTDIALFDLDGVLTRGDTMAALVTHRLVGRPWRLIRAAPLFLLAVAASPEHPRRANLNRRLVALALKGLTVAEYSILATRTGRLLAAKPRFAVMAAIAEVRHCAAHGSRAVIVTASEEILARSFLEAVGLTGIELQASALDIVGRTAELSQHNVGPAKLARVRTAGIDCRNATLYTDSATDIPLAAATARTILVDPRPRSLTRMKAAVPGIEVVRWR